LISKRESKNTTKFVSFNKDNKISIISSVEFENDSEIIKTRTDVDLFMKKEIAINDLKLAFICNWNQKCGISTYSGFLLNSLKDKVTEYKIFSEYNTVEQPADDLVQYCWKRGEKLNDLYEAIKEYRPNCVIIQHEWGLFPNAAHFMKFITKLDALNISYLVTTHSIYEHLDKTIPLSIIKKAVVHTENAKEILDKSKFPGKITVIPHGCPAVNEYPELWNIFQNPYLVFGYGFGFRYKGVEVAIEAIHHLKTTDPKFSNIVYVYVCSENDQNLGVHNSYYESLSDKVKELGVEDNVILVRGFLSEELLSTYLRTVKMALFPYVMEDNNTVYGSSGAIKVAMSYGVPVIASNSHLFDDIDGVVTRITDYKELAAEIDKIFSNGIYREALIQKQKDYLISNSWDNVADMYIQALKEGL